MDLVGSCPSTCTCPCAMDCSCVPCTCGELTDADNDLTSDYEERTYWNGTSCVCNSCNSSIPSSIDPSIDPSSSLIGDSSNLTLALTQMAFESYPGGTTGAATTGAVALAVPAPLPMFPPSGVPQPGVPGQPSIFGGGGSYSCRRCSGENVSFSIRLFSLELISRFFGQNF